MKIFNDYSFSIEPDKAEKIGKFLTYPVHILVGKNYQNDLTLKIQYSTGHKILAFAVLILTSPITIPGIVIGIVFITLSSSHNRCRKIHARAIIMHAQTTSNAPIIGHNQPTNVRYVPTNNEHLRLKEQAKIAAGGDEGGPLHFISHNTLYNMLSTATVKNVPFILDGAAELEHSVGFQRALGFLINNANQGGDFRKIQAALNSKIVSTKLIHILDRLLQDMRSENKHTHQTSYSKDDDLKLQLFINNQNKLALPPGFVEKASELIALFKATDEKTRHLPQFYYE